jgi:hypothetical protein
MFHIYQLQHCTDQEHNSKYEVILNRMVHIEVISDHTMKYNIMSIIPVIREELRTHSMCVVCYKGDHYLFSWMTLDGYSIPKEKHQWYHLLKAFILQK